MQRDVMGRDSGVMPTAEASGSRAFSLNHLDMLMAVGDQEEKAYLRKGRKTPRARAEVMADMAF